MFLPSSAIADTSWITVNRGNVETELLDSNEPAIVFLTSDKYSPDFLEKLKPQIEKFYGDKYKYVTGVVEENGFLYGNVLAPTTYPPLPGLLAVKNGNPLRGFVIDPYNPTPALEYVKYELDANS